MYKHAYSLIKHAAIFSWPGLRRVRNWVYQSYLNAKDIVVDNDVRINQLHGNLSSKVHIGKELHVGAGVLIDLSGDLTIGDRVTISEGAKLYTHAHPIDGNQLSWRDYPVQFGALIIGDEAWIGANAVVLSSVRRIGVGAIVAAGAVLTSDVPDLAVAAGVPARVVRRRRIVAEHASTRI